MTRAKLSSSSSATGVTLATPLDAEVHATLRNLQEHQLNLKQYSVEGVQKLRKGISGWLQSIAISKQHEVKRDADAQKDKKTNKAKKIDSMNHARTFLAGLEKEKDEIELKSGRLELYLEKENEGESGESGEGSGSVSSFGAGIPLAKAASLQGSTDSGEKEEDEIEDQEEKAEDQEEEEEEEAATSKEPAAAPKKAAAASTAAPKKAAAATPKRPAAAVSLKKPAATPAATPNLQEGCSGT